MSIIDLTYKAKENWYNPCSTPISVYRNGQWRLIQAGDRFYYDGAWRVFCGIGNIEMTQSFQKNDCDGSHSGTYVPYTVPADTYFAGTLIEANGLAQDDIDANGQNNANAIGICLLNTLVSILVVDMYSDVDLDVCAFIDTAGVTESNNIVSANIANFYLSTDLAENAYLLSSDKLVGTLVRRFEFNIGKLITLYPNDILIPEFVFKIKGRTISAGTKTGVYALKNPNQKMTMSGSAGSYVPSVTPGGGPTPTPWSASVIGGGNGTVGIGTGNDILTFTYNRLANTISVISA